MEPPGFRHVKLAQHQPQLPHHSSRATSMLVGTDVVASPNSCVTTGLSSTSTFSHTNTNNNNCTDNNGSTSNNSSASNDRISEQRTGSSSSLLVISSSSSEGNVGQQSLISESSATSNPSTAAALSAKRLSNGCPTTSSNPIYTSCTNSNKANSSSNSTNTNSESCGKSGNLVGTNGIHPNGTGVTSVIVENFSSLAVTQQQQQQQLSPASSSQPPQTICSEGCLEKLQSPIVRINTIRQVLLWGSLHSSESLGKEQQLQNPEIFLDIT
ncbi:unnamed protein product [Orchesella dallaii]|uniref:Uncharacterized protein n=1 Tax=Orchesella dallaii TaxID=48710 RepID=A0ABP1QF12_9HEXA